MPAELKIATIGFTQKNAEQFFTLLRTSPANKLIDVRLNNSSQLAGFTKQDDLAFFLREVLHWDYLHLPELAPTKDLLSAYKKHGGDWKVYEHEFLALMEKRRIHHYLSPESLANSCLLCSEHLPDQCHRRLVVEFLARKWDVPIKILHLF